LVSGLHLKRFSSDIARRVGIKEKEGTMVEYVKQWMKAQRDDWKALMNPNVPYRHKYPFMKRVYSLPKALKAWKPKAVRELHYTGYGGVDPAGLYAFYFAIIFGIVGILGLGATLGQTFVAFKGLQ
jgi:hypothetical protein